MEDSLSLLIDSLRNTKFNFKGIVSELPSNSNQYDIFVLRTDSGSRYFVYMDGWREFTSINTTLNDKLKALAKKIRSNDWSNSKILRMSLSKDTALELASIIEMRLSDGKS